MEKSAKKTHQELLIEKLEAMKLKKIVGNRRNQSINTKIKN